MLNYEKMIHKIKEKNINESTVMFMKKEYNKRVARLKKAEEYYNNPNTTDKEAEKTYDEFLKIFDEQNKIGYEIERYTGEKLTIDIIENGFAL